MLPRLLVTCTLITIVVLIACYPNHVETEVTSLIDWMSDNKELGVFMLGLIIVVATSIAIPGTLMTIGTGFIMDAVYEGDRKSIVIGVLTCFLGTWVGSIFSFFIGRYVLRELSTRMA